MLSALPPVAAALLALVLLSLLPGFLVVRAPWTVAPALSVSFWVLSWWWLPLAGRSRVLPTALALFSVLALLRLLPRHTVPPPPEYDGPVPPPPVTGPTTGHVPRLRSAASLTVVGVALATLVPVPLWPHLPGREMAFHTTSTRLALWRDGLPTGYEPLLPLAPFGAHSPALPAVAADISILAGLDPGRSVVVGALLSAALLLLALFGLVATRLRPSSAAVAALLVLAAVRWTGFLAIWGEGGPMLALALGLSAATLLIAHRSGPSAVAAGILLAGAALAQPLLTLVMMVAVWVWVGIRSRVVSPTVVSHDAGEPVTADSSTAGLGMTRRLALALGVGTVFAAPALLRTVRAFSYGEAVAALRSPRPGELADLATGLALAVMATVLAHRLVSVRTRPGWLAGTLVVTSTVFLLVGVHLEPAAGQAGPHDLRALAALEREGRSTQAVCALHEVVDWVPALAGRPVGGQGEQTPRPWVPHVFRDEARTGHRGGCKKMDAASRAP